MVFDASKSVEPDDEGRERTIYNTGGETNGDETFESRQKDASSHCFDQLA